MKSFFLPQYVTYTCSQTCVHVYVYAPGSVKTSLDLMPGPNMNINTVLTLKTKA